MTGATDPARQARGSPTLPLLALAAVGLGLFLLWTSGSAAPGVVEVAARPNDDPAKPFVFDPEVVEITEGSTIHWINGSQTFHTVTFSPPSGERVADGTFEESMFEEGDRIERTFHTGGSFNLFCQPHAEFMIAMVKVVDAPVRTGRRVAGAVALGIGLVGASIAFARTRRGAPLST